MVGTSQLTQQTHLKFEYFKKMCIKCGRTINRFIRTLNTLAKHPGQSIAAASDDAAEAKAIYRLLINTNLTEEVILTAYRKETLRQIKECGESVLLCVQDTTETNYTNLASTQGLGEGNHSKTRGLQVHSCMAMTPSGVALGLLHQKIWARDPQQRGQRKVSRPFEEKESYKWAESAKESAQGLPPGVRPVHMGDREADFFEFFLTVEELEQAYLVRAVQNRFTEREGELLFDRVRHQPLASSIQVHIPRDTRRGLKARETTLEIRYVKSSIQVPQHLKQKLGKDQLLTCTVIHAKEITPPAEGEAIEWFLVTNLSVSTADEAIEKVSWYVQRWKIERFHYILKNGCEVEKLQEHDAEKLKKLILMYSIISIQLLAITYRARETPDEPCTLIFDQEEWSVLYRIANKTKTLPASPPTLREAVAYLAKLGGFLGRKSDGEPGVKVIWRGFRAFQTVLENYRYFQ